MDEAGSMRKLFRVKVCGITNLADARIALDAGADALGFNFCRQSPRYISPARALRIIRRLPGNLAIVGVFVNRSPASIDRIARRLRLDFIQLHGEEPPKEIVALAGTHRVIRVLRVPPRFRPAALRNYSGVTAFMLDGYRRKARGGTGRPFDWRLARQAARFGPVILAGGLNPGNVARAIRIARPTAVDVASGVESRPRKKDAALVRAFVDQAKRAFLELR